MSSGEKMKGPATAAAANLDPNNNKNTGIHTYEAPWPLYGMNWSNRRETRFRLAIGSFIEDYPNKPGATNLTRNDSFPAHTCTHCTGGDSSAG
jgi:hypothetical protein